MVCKANVILRRQSLAKALLLGIAGLLTVPASGAVAAPEDTAEPAEAAIPTCTAESYRAFDFWLGRWQVRLADGTLAGENRIEAAADGCFLTEHWQGARGATGFSMNFYEPASARWRQVWVSAGSIIDISGGPVAGSMVLTGEIRYRQAPTGPGEVTGPLVRPFRGRWTPLPDGRVRQFFEELIEGPAWAEEKWQPWFEGFYSKAVE